MKNSKTRQYALLGFLFGLGFPVLGVLLLRQTQPDLSLIALHRQHILLWLVDMAPLVLSFFSYQIGYVKDEFENYQSFH